MKNQKMKSNSSVYESIMKSVNEIVDNIKGEKLTLKRYEISLESYKDSEEKKGKQN